MTQSNRDHMLACAEAIVREHGARHCTLDAVAKASGMSKGGVLYHFPNKQALLRAMIENAIAEEDDIVAEILADMDDVPEAPLLARIEACQRLIADDDCLSRSILAALTEDPTLIEPIREREQATREAVIKRAPDPEQAELLLFAARGLIMHRILGVSQPGDDTHQRMLERIKSQARELYARER